MNNEMTFDEAVKVIIQAAKGYRQCLQKITEEYPGSLMAIAASDLIVKVDQSIAYVRDIEDGDKPVVIEATNGYLP